VLWVDVLLFVKVAVILRVDNVEVIERDEVTVEVRVKL
jgi:hypothetical protein